MFEDYPQFAIVMIVAGLIVMVGVHAGGMLTSQAIGNQQEAAVAEITVPITVVSATSQGPDFDFGARTDDLFLPRNGMILGYLVENTRSSLYNQNVTGVTLTLANTGSAAGNVTVAWRDSGNSIVHEYAEIDAATLTSTPTEYVYSTSGYTPAVGERLAISYVDTTAVQSTYSTPMAQDTGTSQADIYQSSTSYRRIAEWTRTGASALIGQEINFITIDLQRVGTPTGTVVAGVWNSTGHLLYTFNSRAAESIGTSQNKIGFHNLSSSWTLSQTEYIGVGFEDGGDGSNFIRAFQSGSNPFDSTDSARARWNGTLWVDDSAADVRMTIGFMENNADSHYAVELDGTNDYVFTGDGFVVPNGASGMTIVAWIKPDVTNTAMAVAGNLSNSLTSGWVLDQLNDGSLQFSIYDSGSTVHNYTFRQLMDTTRQQFIAASWDGTNDEVLFCHDDRCGHRSGPGSGLTLKTVADQPVRIGHRQAAGGGVAQFNGNVDEVIVYNRELSETELNTLYDGGTVSSGVRLHYNMNEGTGILVQDESGSGRHGVIINGGTYTTSSVPYFVSVGVNKNPIVNGDELAGLIFDTTPLIATYDLTRNPEYVSVPEHTWVSWNTIKTYSATEAEEFADSLNNWGIQELIIWSGTIPTDWSCSHVVITTLQNAGITLYVEWIEDTGVYLTGYSQSVLEGIIDDVIVGAGDCVAGYTNDVEGMTSNTHRQRWGDAQNTWADYVHANAPGKTFSAYAIASLDASLKGGTTYTNGFDDLTLDFIELDVYKLSADIALSDVNTVLGATSVMEYKPILNQRINTGSAGTPGYQYERFRGMIDAISSDPQIVGLGIYYYSAMVSNTPYPLSKNTMLQFYNGTGYQNMIRVDLAGSVDVSSPPVYGPTLSIDGNTGTRWQTGTAIETDGSIVFDLGQVGIVKEVRFTTVEDHVPKQVSIYTSQTNGNWGSAVATVTPADTTGQKTVDVSDKAGRYVKLEASEWFLSDASYFAVSEMDALFAPYVSNPAVPGVETSTQTTMLALQIIPYALIISGVVWIVGNRLGIGWDWGDS